MVINEQTMKENLTKKYIQLYAEVRRSNYPIEHGFLVTKIKFQEYVIELMMNNLTIAVIICNAYFELKNNKSLQERALAKFEENTLYESYLDEMGRR